MNIAGIRALLRAHETVSAHAQPLVAEVIKAEVNGNSMVNLSRIAEITTTNVYNYVKQAGGAPKIPCIKNYRDVTGCSLKEAKDWVEKNITHDYP